MPELPEVEVFKNIIEESSLRKSVQSLFVEREDILDGISPADFSNILEGDKFESTSRHGKYLFVETDQGNTLFMHFGMTARPVFYTSEGEQPDYTRLVFSFDTGEHLAFDCRRMLGRLGLTDSKEQFVEEKKLGIDALDPELDQSAFRDLIESSRGHVKTTLMKQELIAGIGNEMSDEMLYQAGIHPKTKIADLKGDDPDRLFKIMHEVFRIRISTGADTELLPDTFLLKHREEGTECPRCGGAIERIKVSGRSSYVCPHCQG